MAGANPKVALYVPPAFAASDAAAWSLIRAAPFATLVTAAGGAPFVTHLPLIADGEHTLLGHMARANPHWQRFAEGTTVAIFHGPHAYVTPDAYAVPAREVPTWNFAVVHAHGRVTLLDEEQERLAMVDRTTAHFEAARSAPWQRVVEGERLHRLLGAIVAFRIEVERLEAKFKMNQNKTAADRAGVIAELQRGDADSRAVADWMRAHEPAP